jgi:hypothetical protein
MGACRQIGAITWAVTSCAVLLVTATGFPARATAQPERVHIQFSAPKRCPDSAAFIRAVHQRAGAFQLAGHSEQARTFVVAITQASLLVSGSLEIRGLGAEASLRSVTGKTCDEVMAVLAFMTALAIDPSASSQSGPSPRPVSPTTSSPATSSPPGPISRTARSAMTVSSPPPTSVAPASAPVSSPPSAEERPAPNRFRRDAAPSGEPPSLAGVRAAATASSVSVPTGWKWSAGLHGRASMRMSPTTGLGGLLFIEAAAPGTAVLGPVLRAGLSLNQSDTALASGAEAEFQWAAAMVEACPTRLVLLDPRVTLHACVAFHLGVLRAQGRSLEQAEQTTDLWADLGPIARVRVAVAERLFLEAQGMLVLPLRHLSYDVYYAGPSQSPTTVFTVPWLGVLVGIGVAYEFR